MIKLAASKKGRIEYINTTEAPGGVDVFVTVTSEYDEKKIEPKRVCPGESIYFTQADVTRNKRESKGIFINGLLREAGLEEDLTVIDVRDSMAKIEIREFVNRESELQKFAVKLGKLRSINTLGLVLEQCKEQNKPYKFVESVQNRINKINQKQEDKIKLDE